MRAITVAAVAMLAFACSEPAPPVEPDVPDTDADEQLDTETEDGPAPADDPDPEAAPEPEAEPEPQDAARRYFEAFATSRPGDMQQMLDQAVPGSPAAVYAEIQIAFASALQQEGLTPDPSRLTVTTSGIQLCTDDGAGGQDCTQFEALQTDGGKLAAFTVDGIDIAERLAAGGQTARSGETTVELVGAYHSVQADSLVVALDVRNGTDQTVQLNPYTAEYVTRDGRQVTAADAFAPLDLRSGASAYVALVFPAQGVGGTVYLTGFDDGFVEEFEWELPLTAMGD